MTHLDRLRDCGVKPVNTAGVGVRLTGGCAGFAGLATCGSVWACPVCSAKILARRAVTIGAALSMAEALGHGLGFVTLTMRHRRGQSLAQLWGAASKAWARATSGRAWVGAQALGVIGWVRVWEVTDGPNGWHVHVHAVLVLDQRVNGEALDIIAGGMFRRWSKGLQAAGLEAPLRVGQDWHLVSGDQAGDDVAAYLAKFANSTVAGPDALGLELTHVRPGRARSDLATRPVWSILDGVEDGEARAFRRWWEWETASHGRRQVGWSKGLRAYLTLPEVDASDEEVAAEEMGSAADTLVVIPLDGWRVLVRSTERCLAVLEAAELGGLVGLRALLDEWGDVPYLVA